MKKIKKKKKLLIFIEEKCELEEKSFAMIE